MKTEFRNRAMLPVVLPLAIAGTIAVVVGLFALILLYNSRFTALMLAIVAAAGILIAATLASTREETDGRAKGAIALSAGTPVLIGALIAFGVGGLAEEDLNINRQPHTSGPELAEVPEDAPLLAAESLEAFCLPSGGSCEPTNEWEIPADAVTEGEGLIYAFDNRDTATGPHNLVLFALEGSADAPEAGAPLFEEIPAAFDGPETRAYQTDEAVEDQFYFICTVHPNTMWGVGTIAG